ncbi:hypothetical protein CK231_26010 [Mesorhizobium loti]|uniref:Uncharacterized protein n=1 Tax=Rhizobium loti TaxID=381 RepID=A0A1A5HVC8_RHILI|nr:hypothetical protein BAE41_17600 [Mesorhizobium loti]QGX79442.1 hypothetical protein EB234_23090 [Mesorhizobium japonicum R7A]OBP75465.1 hypothetical protein BAE42_07770 [Mesorhizobium loti]OBP76879.1 hypothetical protein BAE39_12440 [Mesorhizobium loti]OBP86424.1 hypothetical protein BAE38_17610 [Mesorhizobium loti]
MGVAFITDAVVAYLLAAFFGWDKITAVAMGGVFLVGAYTFQAFYGFLSFVRYALFFFAFEKDARIKTSVTQFEAARMPAPRSFYVNPSEYLLEVVNAPDSPSQARLLSGATLGGIETLRATNHAFLAICASIVLEKAVEIYSQRFGLVQGLPKHSENIEEG